MKYFCLTCLLLPLIAGGLLAQGPISWAVTPGVTGTPPHTRENPGAASPTHMYKFGGTVGTATSATSNALWEFDGATWVEKTAEGAPGSPEARSQAGVCWDYGRNLLVVCGGRNSSGTALADTWEWDPITNAWTQIMTAAPTARRFTSIAWDPSGISGDLVMFGGLNASGTHLQDTWIYVSGTGWLEVFPMNVPPTRRQHHLVTRLDFLDVFLCAGQDASLSAPAKWRTDAWTWNGFDWTLIPTANTPAAVVANQAVYDPIRQRIVMTHGNSVTGVQPTSEISEFDTVANDWIVYAHATPATSDPVIGKISRYFAAFLPTTGKIYKIGGQNPGTGASPTTTCEYGLGLPVAFPGNGADAAFEVSINGSVSSGISGTHAVSPTDFTGFRFYSPGAALQGQPFALFASTHPTGMAPTGLALIPGDPLNVWLDPTGLILLLDGLAPTGPFVPTLATGGFNYGPFPVPTGFSGAGMSMMLQVVVVAPGINILNLGLTDAVELQFL